jgi:hypothetical protein
MEILYIGRPNSLKVVTKKIHAGSKLAKNHTA